MWIQTITCLLIVSNFGQSDQTDDKTKFPQPYQFGYTVGDKATGDFKSHQEVNDGREVRGSYSLVEPTGDLRVVTYTADRTNGFRATVNVEPRSQPQPTPAYRLVKLPALQKLRRQHDESTVTTSSAGQATDNDSGRGENSKPSGVGDGNHSDHEPEMTVQKGSLTDKNTPESESQLETGESFDKNTFNVDNLENIGPQVIPVKIEADPSGMADEEQKEVLKVDTTPVNLTSSKDVEYINLTKNITAQKINYHNEKNMETPVSKINMEGNDGQKPIQNNSNPQNVIKSMSELHLSVPNKQPTIQPSSENSFTTIGNLKTTQYQPIQNKNPDSTKILTNVNINEKPKINANMSQTISNNEGIKTADTKQNNMMLAALLLPTTPILKFTCTPDGPDKNSKILTPTMPNNAPGVSHKSPQPISLGPGGSVFTPSIPLFPFQLVNFSPIKQIFTTPQKPVSISATKPPFLTAFSTALFQKPEPAGTAIPQQNTNADHKNEDTLIKAKPPNGYTNLRTDGSASQAHKVQSSYYTHHLLPPPWAPHPLRPAHNSHYRHMPIFVLPMSHNFNYAPTFDPALLDQHNH